MTCTLVLAILLSGAPDLRISVTPAEATVPSGAAVTHTITVTNAGAAAANAVNVTEDWTGGFAFVRITPSSGACKAAAKGFTCNVGALDAGAHATVTVAGNATAVGIWSGSIQAFVPRSNVYPVGTSYALTIVAHPAP
jgi:uncharacterized repeat protein (TIGR01451 family)